MISYVSLGIAIAIGVAAQISLKTGALRAPLLESVSNTVLNPYILAGLAAYFVAALFYIYAIRQVPFRWRFPASL